LLSVTEQIRKTINDIPAGEIIMTSDFADISSLTTIRKCLGRCVEDGLIRRVFDGVYEKPKYSQLIDEYLPADPEKVAYALARNYHWTIAPCGDIVLNKLGLTTQIPAVWSYISDGPYRCFQWNNVQIKFKHRANREISFLSDKTTMIVEAVRTLGKDNIDENVINHLKCRISDEEKEDILKESTSCSEWIYTTLKKICT